MSLQQLSELSPTEEKTNPLYIFYRHAFRESVLFNYSSETVNNFADTIVTDALDVAKDIELASEAMVVMTVFMRIAHDLSSAATKCKEGKADNALDNIETAFALYVGVGQSEGDNDGHLFYNFAERVASHYKVPGEDSVESDVNIKIRKLFEEAKAIATDTESVCGPSTYVALRRKVGSIISMMNLSLVRQFLFLLEENAHVTEQTNYLELFGLVVLPQIKTCQPSNHLFLTREITDNGLDLDAAKTKSLIEAFQKSLYCYGLTCEDVYGGSHASCSGLEGKNIYAGFSTESSVLVVSSENELEPFEKV